jgi:DNA-binding transcriptional MerR regulator|tara:strand:+ start:632 stop:1075 length:444 start_codon:yes stop_codon:yes gene_type:complete
MTDNQSLIDYFTDYATEVDISIEELCGQSRKRDLVEKRMVLMYTLRRSLGMTLHKIAQAFDKNHATVMHAVKTIEDFLKIYPYIRRYYDVAEECLIEHKENLAEYYKSPILSDIERNKQLVDILLDNNDKLKSKIKQLKKELNDNKN